MRKYAALVKRDECSKSQSIFWETFAPKDSGINKKDLSIWNKLESFEKTATDKGILGYHAQTYIYYLPINLSQDQNIDLIREIIRLSFIKKGLIVFYGVNLKEKRLHVHIQVSQRAIEGSLEKEGTFSTIKVGKYLSTRSGFVEPRKIFFETTDKFLQRAGDKTSLETNLLLENGHSNFTDVDNKNTPEEFAHLIHSKFSCRPGTDELIQSLIEIHVDV